MMKNLMIYLGDVRPAADGKPRIAWLEPAEISIGERILPSDHDNVAAVVESFQATGLMAPLLVRVIQPGDQAERKVLIAGLTRHEAATRLGLPLVPCELIECTDAEAVELEIRENLNRRHLDRGSEVWRKMAARLVELRKGDQIDHPSQSLNEEPPDKSVSEVAKGGEIPHPLQSLNEQPSDKGISEVAKELDVDRKLVRTAVKIETSVTPEAKEAARDAGLIDNTSAMLEVSKVPPAEQPKKVEEELRKRQRKLSATGKKSGAASAAQKTVKAAEATAKTKATEDAVCIIFQSLCRDVDKVACIYLAGCLEHVDAKQLITSLKRELHGMEGVGI